MKTRAEYDSATEEWVTFLGGAKNGTWEIIPKGKYEYYVPCVPPPLALMEEDFDATAVMKVGRYRYNGRRWMVQNELGYMVPFRVFEWEGEQ